MTLAEIFYFSWLTWQPCSDPVDSFYLFTVAFSFFPFHNEHYMQFN